ncbi:MAG: phenylacetic acid degradation protein [Thermoflavifilum sp.]|nr:phenylacetic acid degradation protein [Thermoflavifilum sp.]MCL6514360.1 phenylacetic acid degradation protein [Alicyclobacillus sp.]
MTQSTQRPGAVQGDASLSQKPPVGYEVYEVFVQPSQLEPHTHVGSVWAPSPEWAIQVARENFTRRGSAVNLWVVRRRDIAATPYEDEDFFAREFDRKYREVSGYSDNAQRWKRFKARAMSIEDVIHDVREG